jgi:toxin ParE1/3/4
MRNRSFSLSTDAVNDLINIYEFIAEQNPSAARRLVEEIEAKIRDMAASGYTGVARDWIRPGLRALPFRDRCIYFRVDETSLYVLRIVHGKQAIDSDDFEMGDRR